MAREKLVVLEHIQASRGYLNFDAFLALLSTKGRYFVP